MIIKERFPALGRRASTFDHILGDARLSDVDAEFEQFAMDLRRAPQRIGNAHLADKLAYLGRYNGAANVASRLPAPVQSESNAVPADNCVRLHDRQCIANFREQPIKTYEYRSVDGAKDEFLGGRSPQNVELVPQRQNLRPSAARDRKRSTMVQPMSLQRSLIPQQHRPIRRYPASRIGLR